MPDRCEARKRATALVRRFGREWNVHQILNEGFQYWFDARQTACAGYVRAGDWWLVGGAPVCEAGDMQRAAREMRAAAKADGRRLAFVCVSAEAADAITAGEFGGGGWARLAVGAEPVWAARDWPDVIAQRASVRAQVRRAANKGVVAYTADPHAAARRPELRAVLRQWLDRHGLPPMRFLNDPHLLDGDMAGRLVIEARVRGRSVGLLVASPVPARGGYLIELIARGRGAPNGTAELLIDAAMRAVGRPNAAEVSLGVVALSSFAPQQAANPLWVRAFAAWARAHGRRFYHFDGLEQFRQKMRPSRWEPVYVVSGEPAFSPACAYAIATAFCGPPVPALTRAAIKAMKQEWNWAVRRNLTKLKMNHEDTKNTKSTKQ